MYQLAEKKRGGGDLCLASPPKQVGRGRVEKHQKQEERKPENGLTLMKAGKATQLQAQAAAFALGAAQRQN